MYSLSQLSGMGRCTFRRNHNLPTVQEENHNIKREQMIKECILGYLRKEMSIEEVKGKLSAAYDEEDKFPLETRRILADDLTAYLFRYLKSETRYPENAPESNIDIYGVQVMVKPDVFFFHGNELEIVKYSYRKPILTQTGHKLDGSASGSLMLYALLYYGKQLLPYLDNRGITIQVKASIYYLKRKNDNFEKDIFDMDFFDSKEGKNIISLKDNSTFLTSIDQHFYGLFQDFKIGQKLIYKKETCEHCSLSSICRYQPVPQPVKRESVSKPMKEINFSESQRQAICFERGVVRINAGAGAGKTMVIGQRVVNLLQKGYRPEEICVLSFANSSAEEMTERILSYVEQSGLGDKIDIGKLISQTFNSLGQNIIERNYTLLGFQEKPILLEDGEKFRIIEELLTENPVTSLNYRYFHINEPYLKGALVVAKKVFDIFRNYRICDIEACMDFIFEKLDVDRQNVEKQSLRELFALYQRYDAILKKNCYVDYADQEWLLFDLYRINPGFFRDIGFKHIIIDEFQDSSERQMGIIKLLMQSSQFTSLMVVGDDSQAIYGFRDTSSYNIIHFFDIMGIQGTDYFLLENHRSTPEIIWFANEVNKRNVNRVPKDLVATKESIGVMPYVQAFWDTNIEYEFIKKGIREHIEKGRRPEDIAFIAETKSELIKMKNLLEQENIPCVLLNPELVKENPKVQACMSLFSFLTNEGDDAGIATYLNCLCKGRFFDLTPNQREVYLNEYKAYAVLFASWNATVKKDIFFRLADALLTDQDEIYDSFLVNVKFHKTWGSVCKYMYHFSSYGDANAVKKTMNYPGVVLTTAHSSKGLEWPVVYNTITKYDNQLLRSPGRREELEERRRLLFVSLTRAQEELYITGKYYSFGTVKDKNFNFFLKECYEILGKDIEMEYKNR